MKAHHVILGLALCGGIFAPDKVKADGANAEVQYAEELQRLVKDAEESAKLENAPVVATRPHPKLPVVGGESSDEIIVGLLDQVQRLKAKGVVEKRTIVNLESPRRSMHLGSKTVYPYIEGKLYEVHAGIDKVTDIALQPGEKLINAPMAGDTVRWKVGLLTSGGREESSHVIIKPLESDLETNLIVTTDRRIYHLRLLSGDWYMPSVAWDYPQEEKTIDEQLAERRAAEEEEPIRLPPEQLRFDYEVKGDDVAWKPEVVFDDGEKTYLKLSEKMKGTEAPVFFVLTDNDEPMLVNYRVKGRFYVVDRLFERAELRIGEEKVVSLISPSYKRSFFERIF